MPIQGPQWTEFLACPVCYNGFNSRGREPVSLACGHSICKSCLSHLSKQSCPFDQTEVKKDINDLPFNYALLQLVGEEPPETLKVDIEEVEENHVHFEGARKCIECLGLFLASLVNNNGASPAASIANGTVAQRPPSTPLNTLSGSSLTSGCANLGASSGVLTRPMQRKLVTLVNCQLAEEEGRCRALRAARSLGERAVKELILLHQNPQQLSANLWSAVRSRGCQFLGPAMQEDVLRLILLALEEGSSLCRKVLVLYVVQRLETRFTQASKTSIGHVVQLLYRASCFKVTKREGDSSLLQLQERYRTYSALRKEHDAQIVQIAMEAGLHISPEQWSALLYGDDSHKSHMQSIIDKLQTPASFSTSIQELIIALQRTGDPANLQRLRTHLDLLAKIDPNPEGPAPSWSDLSKVMDALKVVVYGLVDFMQNHSAKIKGSMEPQQPVNSKYKTHMCRDIVKKGSCPRGTSCSFAHSNEELEKYGRRRKTMTRRGVMPFTPTRNGSSSSPETVDGCDKASGNGLDTSASDRECTDTLPEESASTFRRVTQEPQQGLLLQEVQNGIRAVPLCNPTQYQATVNGTYAPSFTYSAGVADRNSAGPSPMGYLNGTVHGTGIPNGGVPSQFYSSPQPPPVNGLGGSFGRPAQIPSPGIAPTLPASRDPHLNGQSEVTPYYDGGRQRTDSYPTPMMGSPYVSAYCPQERYAAMMVPNRFVLHHQYHAGLDNYGNFPSAYYPVDNRTKGPRLFEETASGSAGTLRAKGFSNDFETMKNKQAWQLAEGAREGQSKHDVVAKFGKLPSMGSCADTSSSSYDYLSDTFSPTSSGSSHQGSPPGSMIDPESIGLGLNCLVNRNQSNVWGLHSQGSYWPQGEKGKHLELGKAFENIREVWQHPQNNKRLQHSYDEDSFTGLNRSLQDDPSNTSCESNTPSLPDASKFEKEDTNRSYDDHSYALGFMKPQGMKACDTSSCFLWDMGEKEALLKSSLEDERSFMQRCNMGTQQKTRPPPPPGLKPEIKPIGSKGERYQSQISNAEGIQGSSQKPIGEAITDIESMFRGTRQVGVKFGSFNDLTVHE